MQLTFRGRKGSNLQSDNLQLWALFILLTFLNFRVEFQCPPLSESLEMSWNGMKDWMWHMCHLCNKNPGKKVSAFEQILLQKSTLGNITIVTWQFPFFSDNKMYYLFAAWGQTSPASNPVQENTARCFHVTSDSTARIIQNNISSKLHIHELIEEIQPLHPLRDRVNSTSRQYIYFFRLSNPMYFWSWIHRCHLKIFTFLK